MPTPIQSTLTCGKIPQFFLLSCFLRDSVNSVVSTPLVEAKGFSKSICGEFLQASVLRSVRNSHPVNHPFGKTFNSSDNPLP